MKNRILLTSAACVLAAALGFSPALAAGGEEGDWEIGAFAGWAFLDQYAGIEPDSDLLYGARVGYYMNDLCSIELSQQFLSTESSLSSLANTDVDMNSTRLNLLFNFLKPGSVVRPFLTVGAGREATSAEHIGNSYDFGINAGGGARFFISDSFAIRADARYVTSQLGGEGFVTDHHEANFEGTLGVAFAFGGQCDDLDTDGVCDRRDKCPGTPAGCMVDAEGCPKDADGDGVCDGVDTCADTPKGYPVDARGCPTDSDGDGVVDGLDKCPNTPKGCTVDANGCPQDADGDGVCDGLDKCPNTTKGCAVDATGCQKDSDGDGVCDGIDRCPGTPKGEKVDAVGCSETVVEEGKAEVILKGVTFATNKADLTAESTAILDQVAASLVANPEVNVELGGHTDSTGTKAWNDKLSQMRAESAMKYLESKGVAASRMTARGYGSSVPIADNKTAEGRQQNRRTEVKRVN